MNLTSSFYGYQQTTKNALQQYIYNTFKKTFQLNIHRLLKCNVFIHNIVNIFLLAFMITGVNFEHLNMIFPLVFTYMLQNIYNTYIIGCFSVYIYFQNCYYKINKFFSIFYLKNRFLDELSTLYFQILLI